MTESIKVAAGILQDAAGQVLVTERLGDTPFAGLWEFPGGKVNDGEAIDSALRRELLEELGVTIRDFDHFMRVEHSYPDRLVSIDFFIVTNWRSDPKGMEGQGIRWVSVDRINAVELLPADAPVVRELRKRSATFRKCLSET